MDGINANTLCKLLQSHRLRFSTEALLQDDIERLLTREMLPYVREAPLSLNGRFNEIDFLVAGDDGRGIGIECKIDGSRNAVYSQLLRYANSDKVGSLILLTSRKKHDSDMAILGGKPFYAIWVGGNSL